jgi:hypothetical protein
MERLTVVEAAEAEAPVAFAVHHPKAGKVRVSLLLSHAWVVLH